MSAGRRDLVPVLARRVLPWLVVLGTLVAMTEAAAAPLTNGDTYFHLRFGHEFLTGAWSLRHPGHVSTFETAHWVPTQWLTEVVMAWCEVHFGLAGVAWWSGVQLLALTVALVLVTRREATVLVVAPLVVLTLLAANDGLSARPQVVSYLLVAVVVGLWLRARDTGRIPWVVVPLTWVWAMSHGMWPLGIVISLVAAVGLLVDGHTGVAGPRVGVRVLLVPLGSAVVAALTPVGPALYPAVVQVDSRAKYFAEWGPPDFTSLSGVCVLLLLGVLLTAMLRAPWSGWSPVLLAGLSLLFAVYSMRTVPVAAVMLCPLTARAVTRATGSPGPAGVTGPRIPRREVWGVVAVALLCLGALALEVPHTANRPIAVPSWLDPAVAALPTGTPMLDDSGMGGYLMWRYPRLDLVAHGYGDVYTDAELDRLVTLSALNPGWDTQLHALGVRYAVLRPYQRIAYALVTQEGWRVLHSSADLELLQAPPDW